MTKPIFLAFSRYAPKTEFDQTEVYINLNKIEGIYVFGTDPLATYLGFNAEESYVVVHGTPTSVMRYIQGHLNTLP